MTTKRRAKPTDDPAVVVKMLAARTCPDYRYLVGEVRAIPRPLAEQFIKERAATFWAGAPVPVKIAGKDADWPDTDEDEPGEPKADEPKAPHVPIADRLPKAKNE